MVALVGVVGLGVALVLASWVLWREATSLALEDYRHTDSSGEVLIDVTDGVFTVAVHTASGQVGNLGPLLQRLAGDPSLIVGETDSDGIIRIELAWDHYNQPSVVTFLDCEGQPCAIKGYFEVLRQSPSALKAIYGIDKVDGYSILGRTDMALPLVDSLAPKPAPAMTVAMSLDLTADLYPEPRTPSAALAEAIAIVRYMWSQPVRTGPFADHSAMSLPALDQLEQVRVGTYSAQCGTFRDIFMSLAVTSHRIAAVRAVDLYQGWPQVGDLMFNGHSIVEILDADAEEWFALDPWGAAAFRVNGHYVDASALSSLDPDARAGAEIVELADRNRYFGRREAAIPPDILEAVMRLPDMNHGYMEYFNIVVLGEVFRNPALSLAESSGDGG